MEKLSVLAFGSALAFLLISSAAAMPNAPQGSIPFVTGGIGDEEKEELRSERSHYKLHVINEGRQGAFIGSEHLTIRDRKGHDVLSADGGPLFYTTLPPGRYTIESQVGDRIQSKRINLASNQSSDVRFIW